MALKILADENFPLLEHFFADKGDIITKPGEKITAGACADADILLVRSKTFVDENLLKNSRVKFVGSGVSGFDHLDSEYLEKEGIAYSCATGCNAKSVTEYVLSTIAALISDNLMPQRGRIGIVGVGNIGLTLAQVLFDLGYEVLLNDPPVAAEDPSFPHVDLSDFRNLDCISLHPSMLDHSVYSAHHLITGDFLKRQKEGCVLINASRGEVINEDDLKVFGGHLICCLDVYDNEPDASRTLVEKAYIATAHIAGHSMQGKYRGSEMVYRAASRYFGWPAKRMPYLPVNKVNLKASNWHEEFLKVFDIREESNRTKKNLLKPGVDVGDEFNKLRKSYGKRFEVL